MNFVVVCVKKDMYKIKIFKNHTVHLSIHVYILLPLPKFIANYLK